MRQHRAQWSISNYCPVVLLGDVIDLTRAEKGFFVSFSGNVILVNEKSA